MLYRLLSVLALLFHNALFAEVQGLCRTTGVPTGFEVECGILSITMESSLAGGRAALREEMPWHAGIYSRQSLPFMQICGGSLVSSSVVISAAHCFWIDQQQQRPVEEFAVAVGKLYRPYNDKMDVNAQKSDISEIHIPPRYHGSTTNFQDDLAVLIMATPFLINAYVQPICLDFDDDLDSKHLVHGNMGKVAGWGRSRTDKNGKASPTLQVVNLPSVDVQRCYEEIEPVFRPALTSDKICAGNNTAGTAVCMGDSGGGLSFPENISGIGQRFYLRGVVSTAPNSVNNDLCNVYTYATFTHVIKHEHFIRKVMLGASKVPVTNQTSSVIISSDQPSSGLVDPLSLPIPSKSSSFPNEFVTGGNPKPLPEYAQKDLDRLVNQYGAVTLDSDEQTESTADTKPEEEQTVDPLGLEAIFQSVRPQSDPDAEKEYTVEVREQAQNIPYPQTDLATEKVPYLSTGPRPYVSTEYNPPQSTENKSNQSSENQTDQTKVVQPALSIENQPAQTFGVQPAISIEDQPTQSIGAQPAFSNQDQPAQTIRVQPAISIEDQPTQSIRVQPAFSKVQPAFSVENQTAQTKVTQQVNSTKDQPAKIIGVQPAYTIGSKPAQTKWIQPAYFIEDKPDQAKVVQTAFSIKHLPAQTKGVESAYSTENQSAETIGVQPAYSIESKLAQTKWVQPAFSIEDEPAQTIGATQGGELDYHKLGYDQYPQLSNPHDYQYKHHHQPQFDHHDYQYQPPRHQYQFGHQYQPGHEYTHGQEYYQNPHHSKHNHGWHQFPNQW